MKEPKAKTEPPAKLNFGVVDNPPNPNPDPLVNENREHQSEEEYVTDPDRVPVEEMTDAAQLQALVVKLEDQVGQMQIKNNELRAKLSSMEKTKSNYSDVSRKFRIFLNLVQGFAARGMFDQSELVKKPGTEHNIMKHAAGLAEVANKATENRF